MIRKYNESDILDIIKLEEKLLNTSLGYNILHDRLDDDNFLIYVYEDLGINGYISSYFDGYTLEILNFCIALDYQRKGIGTMLLDEVISKTIDAGLKNIVLEVRSSNEKAINFYTKNGFKIINVRKGYYGGEDAFLMEKIIR